MTILSSLLWFLATLWGKYPGKIIKSPEELRPALEEAFEQNGPAIIAVPVDYRENLKLTKRLGELEFTI